MQFTHAVTPSPLENVPTVHERHMSGLSDPSAVKYFPAGHKLHETVPAWSEYEPATHLLQVASLAAPSAVEKVPATQAWQADGVGAPGWSE